MGTGKCNAGGNPAMDQHPIQGGVDIIVTTSREQEFFPFDLSTVEKVYILQMVL